MTAAPGRHGPGLIDRLLPDVMGSVIELEEDGSRRLTLYITGDTLHTPALSEVPRRFGQIDAMLIHLGGTRLLGLMLTMDDRQGVEVSRLINPHRIIPIHYDDYSVMASPLSAFLARAHAEGLTGVRPVTRGDTLDLPLA